MRPASRRLRQAPTIRRANAAATINQIAGQLAGINRRFQENFQASQDPALDAELHAGLEKPLPGRQLHGASRRATAPTRWYLGGQTPLVIGHDQFNVSADFSAPLTAIRDSQGNDITSEIDNGQLGALPQREKRQRYRAT